MGNQQSEIPMNDEEFRNKTFQKMDKEIRVKLSKGVNWNLKIIIKGERKSGKSCLFARLQGKKFIEEYIPTNQIQTTHINWSYKNSHDNVKVEVWDVVDSSVENETKPGKINDEKFALDAKTINVYRGANAVIMPFSPFERNTWEYIVNEVPKVPLKTHILILANFKDLSDNIVVSKSEIESFISKQNHHIYLLETSMRNCFGLKGLKSFINIPFLNVQKDYYNDMLNDTLREINLAEEEFKILVEDETYENYLKLLSTRVPKQNTPTSKPSENILAEDIPQEIKTKETQSSIKIKQPTTSAKLRKYTIETPEEKKGFLSSLFTKSTTKNEINKNEVIETKDTIEELLKLRETAKKGSKNLKSHEEFSPDIDDSWLKETNDSNRPNNISHINKYNDDSDEDAEVKIISDEVEVEVDYDFDFDLKPPLKKDINISDDESAESIEEPTMDEIELDTLPDINQNKVDENNNISSNSGTNESPIDEQDLDVKQIDDYSEINKPVKEDINNTNESENNEENEPAKEDNINESESNEVNEPIREDIDNTNESENNEVNEPAKEDNINESESNEVNEPIKEDIDNLNKFENLSNEQEYEENKKVLLIEEPIIDIEIDDLNHSEEVSTIDNLNDIKSINSLNSTENALDSFVPQMGGIDEDDFWNDEPTDVKVAVLYKNEDENNKQYEDIGFDDKLYEYDTNYNEELEEEGLESDDNGYSLEGGYEAL